MHRFLVLLILLFLRTSGGDTKSNIGNLQRHRPIDLDDADEMGIALGLGLTSVFSRGIQNAGKTVRTLTDTAGAAAGGSVKVLGSAVKSVASVMESFGDNVAQAGDGSSLGGAGADNVDNTERLDGDLRVPGAGILGAAIRGAGSAANGLGDTVVGLGVMTEEIASETGKLVEGSIKALHVPIDLISGALLDAASYDYNDLSGYDEDEGEYSNQNGHEDRHGYDQYDFQEGGG